MRPLGPKLQYSVNPTAFAAALILAPIVVTIFSFWTIAGLFAPIFGAIPYLIIGTPLLLWATGRIRPGFCSYAQLGLCANTALFVLFWLMTLPDLRPWGFANDMMVLFGFGIIFGTLWAGAFGSLYARFHPNIRILKS